MGTINEDLTSIKTVEDTLNSNKVSRFAYTQSAYDNNTADGVSEYDPESTSGQFIPASSPSVLNVNSTVLDKGWRAQASSITRMLMNHFLGRLSYNVNKLTDNMTNLVNTFLSHLGTANGIATLDSDGRIPYSQLPESAIELKGTWNAATNVWTGNEGTTGSLIDGEGTLGDMYIVTTMGWFDSSTGTSSATEVEGYTEYDVNDRILYNGSTWSRLATGDVKSVNGKTADDGNVTLYGSDIEMNSSDSSKLDDQINARQKNVITLTQAEYNALSSAQRAGNLYIITDSTSYPSLPLNDDTVSTDSAWSSSKTSMGTTIITANSTTITGGALFNGAIIRVFFISAITGSNETSAMSLTYNGTSYSVYVGKNGTLANFTANLIGSTYLYLQAYTTLELMFNGSNFIIIGNPVVLSSADYTIYADGEKIGVDTTPTSGSTNFVTSSGVYNSLEKNKYKYVINTSLNAVGWYKICTFARRNSGGSLAIDLCSNFANNANETHHIQLIYSWQRAHISELAAGGSKFDKIRICYNNNDYDAIGVYVHYNVALGNGVFANFNGGQFYTFTPYNFEIDSLTWDNTIEYELGVNGFYVNGTQLA